VKFRKDPKGDTLDLFAGLFAMFNDLRTQLTRLPSPEQLPIILGQWQSDKSGKSRKLTLRWKLLFMTQGLKRLLDRPPSLEEIAEACDVPRDTVYRVLRLSEEVEVDGEKRPLASVASGLKVVSSSRLGMKKAVHSFTTIDPESKKRLTNVSKVFLNKGKKKPQGYAWARAEDLYDTSVPSHPLDLIKLSPSDRDELNRYVTSEPFVKVYREVLVGFLEYDLRLLLVGVGLPLDKRHALMEFLTPVLEDMVKISRRAGGSGKDVKLEEVFPLIRSKTPELDDFPAKAAKTFEEIRVLPSQAFVEKFLLPQASVFASN